MERINSSCRLVRIEHDNKSLIYMPCYTDDVIGTKILTIFPENSKLGLPSIDGVILLNNAVTGAPEALLDGQSVTAWRTGAVGGVGIVPLTKVMPLMVSVTGFWM